MGAQLVDVTGVTVLGHYRLHLTFSDGKIGDVDVSDLKEAGGVFAALRDPDYFAQVSVDRQAGTVVWPNGADLAPDRLYDEARAPSGGQGAPAHVQRWAKSSKIPNSYIQAKRISSAVIRSGLMHSIVVKVGTLRQRLRDVLQHAMSAAGNRH